VFPRIPFNQRHRRQGRGMLHPPPRQPLSHGAISNRCTAMRGILSAVNVNTLTEIPFLLPMARYPVLSPHTARPLWRGREEAAERPGGGGVSTNTVQPEAQETGAGDAPSPAPASPSPTGVILHRYSVPVRMSRSAAQREHPHRDPFPAPHARYPVLSPHTARPLRRGREEAAERPGGGGGRRIPFNQRRRRQGRGMLHPPPRQPLPHGGDIP